MGPATSLFGQDYPPGLLYLEDFLTPAEETDLLDSIGTITFGAFEMRGVVARRRVAYFGQSYDRTEAKPFPEFLLALRRRIGKWTGVEAAAFAMCLINEYPPGAPIGWHRDAPQHDVVAGVSLLSACRMKFRPYLSPALAGGKKISRPATHEIALERRSAYFMTGESRNAYEHHIPPVSDLRYSVTFRTLR
jgi:alkylated DNA repair dioxygenase AlkB